VRAPGKHSAEVDGVHRIDHGLGHESFLPRSTRDPELSGPPMVLVGICQRKTCSLVRAEKVMSKSHKSEQYRADDPKRTYLQEYLSTAMTINNHVTLRVTT